MRGQAPEKPGKDQAVSPGPVGPAGPAAAEPRGIQTPWLQKPFRTSSPARVGRPCEAAGRGRGGPSSGVLLKPTGAWFEEASGVRRRQRFPGGRRAWRAWRSRGDPGPAKVLVVAFALPPPE